MAELQDALFTLPGNVTPLPTPASASTLNRDALARIALLYTATEKGTNSGVRFALPSIEEARIWCSSPLSRGQMHGTRWAYMYTSALNFVECHWGQGPRIVSGRIVDNGEWDERIASLGLHKISVADFPAVFEPLGVTVVTGRRRRVAA